MKDNCPLPETIEYKSCTATIYRQRQGRGWTSQIIQNVEISAGIEIRVGVEGAPGRLDYVQLDLN